MILLMQRIIAVFINTSLMHEKQKLSTNLQSIEEEIVKASIDVGDKLYNALLRKIDESNITNIYIIQAQFQADTILALRCITDKNEFVFSNDTDQAVLCGSKCLSIKKYTLLQKCNEYTINGIEIFSSSLLSIQLMCTTLEIDINNKYYITPAKFPIFDGIDNLRLRSLIAVGVGCDVYLKSTMTVKQMSECITQIKTTYENNNASQAYQLLKAKLISARFNRKAPPNTNVDIIRN